MIFVESNILTPHDRTTKEETHKRIVDYLLKYYSNGFDGGCDIYVNNVIIELDKWDMDLKDDDIIVLIHRPAVAIAGAPIASFLINLAISTAVSYAIGKIFAPDIPKPISSSSTGNRGQSSSVYSLNAQQNEAKSGEAIPVIYGKVRTYPALITAPYRRYEDNEEYIYQLMCLGQGKYNINELLIADSKTINLGSDVFKSRKFEYSEFSVADGIIDTIEDEFGDTNYAQLVKTLADVDNLEMRGSPHNPIMVMRFEGSNITFFDYADGTSPDLSSLQNGSTIIITETVSNNGTYTVDYVTGNVVTVQSHTFTTEPTDTIEHDVTPVYLTFYAGYLGAANNSFHIYDTSQNHSIDVIADEIFKLDGTAYNDDTVFQANDSSSSSVTYVKEPPNVMIELVSTGIITVLYHAKHYKAEFQTTYGAYIIKGSTDTPLKALEFDYHYPYGIYDTNAASGDLEDRNTQFKIILENPTTSEGHTETVSITEKDNSPKRFTYRYNIVNAASKTSNWEVKLERVTFEPTKSSSMDKIFMRALKGIYAEFDNEPFGDITLLWCKIRATNAISSIGQFAINAWVTRSDVGNTVKDVITDIYTNTDYGGRLPAADLDLPTTTETINGAIDSKLTIFDALKMAAKSNRYNVYPVGAKIKMKKDEAQTVRTALYNETNMIQDSFKLSYNFSEESETDSVKVIYRNDDDFKQAEALYPSTGSYPEEIELWGNTDSAIALAMATYLYKQDRARRKVVEFKTDVQGLIPQFMDKIGISHNLPDWGISSEVRGVSGSVVTLADSLDAALGYDSVIFRDDDGSVSAILSFTGSGYDITVTSLPTWVHGFNDFEPTKCSLGKSNKIISDFIVTSVKPNGNQVLIQGVNYDAAIYS